VLTAQTDYFPREPPANEEGNVVEKVGFADSLDLITLREKLRKHGVVQ
jgi:hypothetical protein